MDEFADEFSPIRIWGSMLTDCVHAGYLVLGLDYFQNVGVVENTAYFPLAEKI
jgi:hypothetical protein